MKGAKATTRGWINPKTGELLKCQKMTQEQADALNGEVLTPPQPPQTLNEAPSFERKLTKKEVKEFLEVDESEEDED